MERKALIVAGCGTTLEDALRRDVMPVEAALLEAFPDHTIARAWTSRKILGKARARGAFVGSPGETIARLRDEGFTRIAVASTHIIPGAEYGMLLREAEGVPVSPPLLSCDDDLRWMSALLRETAEAHGRAVIAVGHGSDSAADDVYARLSAMLPETVLIACTRGASACDAVLPRLRANGERSVLLIPLMLAAGYHAQKDIAALQERLTAEALDAQTLPRGLGAHPEVQRRFVEKARRLFT